jgi:hypothetical protein
MHQPLGTKECPAAEPHGLPRPVLGADGEVTAVSTNPNPNKDAVRRPTPMVGWRQLTGSPQGFPSGRA